MSPSPSPEQILQQLSNELMSPFCPGRTVASCPSPQARKLEDRILAEARAGKSRDEIEQALVAQYGRDIVGYQGDPWVLWGPFVAGLVALILVAWAVRRWVRGSAQPSPEDDAAAEPGGLDAEDRRRLEDALDEIDAF
ncbi:MAG: cytochrome c-type biogenesis protein CcmH [Deltaproteobacteria bacterium]|nr:MAG: cytochrome c-type biogenesis protein CcmH [Deltaproteobacteria bacterium]